MCVCALGTLLAAFFTHSFPTGDADDVDDDQSHPFGSKKQLNQHQRAAAAAAGQVVKPISIQASNDGWKKGTSTVSPGREQK